MSQTRLRITGLAAAVADLTNDTVALSEALAGQPAPTTTAEVTAAEATLLRRRWLAVEAV